VSPRWRVLALAALGACLVACRGSRVVVREVTVVVTVTVPPASAPAPSAPTSTLAGGAASPLPPEPERTLVATTPPVTPLAPGAPRLRVAYTVVGQAPSIYEVVLTGRVEAADTVRLSSGQVARPVHAVFLIVEAQARTSSLRPAFFPSAQLQLVDRVQGTAYPTYPGVSFDLTTTRYGPFLPDGADHRVALVFDVPDGDQWELTTVAGSDAGGSTRLAVARPQRVSVAPLQ
jgi:hypothetical protein